MEDDHTGDGVLLTVVRVTPLAVGGAVPQGGFWKRVQMSVAFGVHRRLKDGVWEGDGRVLVQRTGTPQGLVPREFGASKVHLFQTVHRDDCRNQPSSKRRFFYSINSHFHYKLLQISVFAE